MHICLFSTSVPSLLTDEELMMDTQFWLLVRNIMRCHRNLVRNRPETCSIVMININMILDIN